MARTIKSIDLSLDAGESFGTWQKGADDQLLPLVTSINLACGFHAGDPETMFRTAKLAKFAGVRVGAHPGFRDLLGFGRRALDVSAQTIYTETLYQLGALAGLLRPLDVRPTHVAPHGALSWLAWRDRNIARTLIEAIRDFDSALPVVTVPGTLLGEAANAAGVSVVHVGFPDRRYAPDGTLAPRSMEGSVITDPEEAADQAAALVTEGSVRAIDGSVLHFDVDSLLFHGDNPRALEIIQAVRERLTSGDAAVSFG